MATKLRRRARPRHGLRLEGEPRTTVGANTSGAWSAMQGCGLSGARTPREETRHQRGGFAASCGNLERPGLQPNSVRRCKLQHDWRDY